jgi:hypothetical protein
LKLGRGGKAVAGEMEGVILISKAIQNCHNKSPLYNEYMLIKMEKKKLVLLEQDQTLTC